MNRYVGLIKWLECGQKREDIAVELAPVVPPLKAGRQWVEVEPRPVLSRGQPVACVALERLKYG